MLKTKLTDRQKPQDNNTYFAYWRPVWLPTLLSTPDMLGNWTDGRIACRHSMPTFFQTLQPIWSK